MDNQMNHCNNQCDSWSTMGCHNCQSGGCDNKKICDYFIGPTGPQGERGLRGCPGKQGTRGYPGAAGRSAFELAVEEGYTGTIDEWLDDLVGPTGPAGPAGTTGIIIPFASGNYVDLRSGADGSRSTVGTIGFGNRTSYAAPVDPINITTDLTEAHNQAFSMPVSGVITKMSAYYSLAQAGEPGEDNMITAQLYYSPVPNDLFMPVPGATILLGTVPGGEPRGMILHGVTDNLSVSIEAETRLLMVFYNTTPQNIASHVAGYISAGVKIE